MSQRSLLLLGIVIVAAILLRIVLWFSPSSSRVPTVTIGEKTITVTVARTTEEQIRGLSLRASLATDHGMLFWYPDALPLRFWMKGMQFPLDMIWIVNGRVADITHAVPAPAPGTPDTELPVYMPRVPVSMMLEVNAGTADRYGWKVGDLVRVEL